MNRRSDGMNAGELAEALRKADYDTPYVWDLTAQAADLIEAQSKALEEMRGRVAVVREAMLELEADGVSFDGGDVRMWAELLRQALSQKDTP